MGIKILEEGLGYVVLTYPDNSVRVIYTSFNAGIIERFGGELRSDAIFDFNRKEYVEFAGLSAKIYKEKPVLKGVDKFVDRF